MPDAVVAKRLERSKMSVYGRRITRGIYRYRNRPGYGPWTSEEEAALGKFTDSEVARRLGGPKKVVLRRPRKLAIRPLKPVRYWTSQEIALLGKLPEIGRAHV